MRLVVRYEPETGLDSTEAPRVRISMVRCLDWHCDDFGLLGPIEIKVPGEKEPAVWCPNQRARCPLP